MWQDELKVFERQTKFRAAKVDSVVQNNLLSLFLG